jgi:CDP-paratose 2-epimerase
MSCIYGPRQFGTEDQGWVAHFLVRAQAGEPITIYGDGKQVRDILYVDDLVDAMVRVEAQSDRFAASAFNIGGGPANTLSLLELLDLIAEFQGRRPFVRFAETRTGDQRYYVSDTNRFRAFTGWAPKIAVRKGVELLNRWLLSHGIADRTRMAVGTSGSSNAQGATM